MQHSGAGVNPELNPSIHVRTTAIRSTNSLATRLMLSLLYKTQDNTRSIKYPRI